MERCEKNDPNGNQHLNEVNAASSRSNIDKKYTLTFLKNNFMEVVKNDDIVELDLDTLVELLESDDLMVDNEVTVYQCVKRWIDCNLIDPSNIVYKLIKTVRFKCLPNEMLVNDVLPFVTEALRWKYCRNQSQVSETVSHRKYSQISTSTSTSPSTATSKCILAVGANVYEKSKMVEIYDSSKTWRRLKDLNLYNIHFTTGVLDNSLIIAGGWNENYVDTAYEVNLETGVMNSLKSMNEARHNFPLVTVSDSQSSKIYAIAGKGRGDVSLRTVEVYDSKTKDWKNVTPMIIPREGCGAALHGNRIYAVGGFDSTTGIKQNTLEVYNIKEDRWQMRTPMSEPRVYPSVLAIGDYLYVMGGHRVHNSMNTPMNTVERYDIFDDRWITLANMTNSGYIAAAILDNSPVSLGGFDSKNVEKYNATTNVWEKLDPLSTPRRIFFAVNLPPKFNDVKIDWK